ncbi:MAG: 2-isopropylmalate synthase [Christensenella sp.]|nr:2-isopropylmalate synthase [Christensenella sp.]
MIKYSDTKNVLMESNWKPNLQDVGTPNLYRELYSYDSIPKIAFNFRQTPMEIPSELWITDTTFRDGQQATKPFTSKQIVELYKMMHRFGGKKGIIRQSEFFLYSEKDREAVRACMELGYDFPEITSWIRASEKDFELVKEMKIKETGILVSCSDYHIFKKMNLTRKQAADKYLNVVKMALDKGIVPRCHFEDITRADFYGFVAPLAYELMQLSKESGIPIKIRACDTMGYGISYPGVTLPRSVPGIISGLRYYGEVPSEQLEWHGHNDFYKVVTNAATAWLYGCSSVNGTLMGIGERTGNCPIEAMAVEYAALKGTSDGIDFTVIKEIGEYFKSMGIDIPDRTPFVGKSFNVTRAGIHADGLLKDPEIYNICDTEKIFGVPPRVAVDSHSGLAGIAFWLNSYYGLKNADAIDKKSDTVEKIKEMVDREYDRGRTACMSDSELEMMLQSVNPDLYNKLKIKQ